MKRKKIIINNHRIIIDEINYYYPKDTGNKEKTQTEYKLYIEFTNRERLIIKFSSLEQRDETIGLLDAEFD